MMEIGDRRRHRNAPKIVKYASAHNRKIPV